MCRCISFKSFVVFIFSLTVMAALLISESFAGPGGPTFSAVVTGEDLEMQFRKTRITELGEGIQTAQRKYRTTVTYYDSRLYGDDVDQNYDKTGHDAIEALRAEVKGHLASVDQMGATRLAEIFGWRWDSSENKYYCDRWLIRSFEEIGISYGQKRRAGLTKWQSFRTKHKGSGKSQQTTRSAVRGLKANTDGLNTLMTEEMSQAVLSAEHMVKARKDFEDWERRMKKHRKKMKKHDKKVAQGKTGGCLCIRRKLREPEAPEKSETLQILSTMYLYNPDEKDKTRRLTVNPMLVSWMLKGVCSAEKANINGIKSFLTQPRLEIGRVFRSKGGQEACLSSIEMDEFAISYDWELGGEVDDLQEEEELDSDEEQRKREEYQNSRVRRRSVSNVARSSSVVYKSANKSRLQRSKSFSERRPSVTFTMTDADRRKLQEARLEREKKKLEGQDLSEEEEDTKRKLRLATSRSSSVTVIPQSDLNRLGVNVSPPSPTVETTLTPIGGAVVGLMVPKVKEDDLSSVESDEDAYNSEDEK